MDVIWEVGSCVIKFPSLRSRVKMRHVDEVLQSNPVLVCYLSNRHYYPTKYSYKICFKYSPRFTLGNDASTDKKIYQIFLELLSSRLLLQWFWWESAQDVTFWSFLISKDSVLILPWYLKYNFGVSWTNFCTLKRHI